MQYFINLSKLTYHNFLYKAQLDDLNIISIYKIYKIKLWHLFFDRKQWDTINLSSQEKVLGKS